MVSHYLLFLIFFCQKKNVRKELEAELRVIEFTINPGGIIVLIDYF